MESSVTLEKYSGPRSRHICPNCGKKEFVRYVDRSGNYIREDVGRCNRESKCTYHLRPREIRDPFSLNRIRPRSRPKRSVEPTKISVIHPDEVVRSLSRFELNAFIVFLGGLFQDSPERVAEAIRDYQIGTTDDGRTIFWQIDANRRVRSGKIIAYDAASGKRQKDIHPSWVHSDLIRTGKMPSDFTLDQCYFGEHLLKKYPSRDVALVESEKSAVIASMTAGIFPDFIWLACGGRMNFKIERLACAKDRRIYVYPDADSYEKWKGIASDALKSGFRIRVSDLIERNATSEEKSNGFDLADYLIREFQKTNEYNTCVDHYNAALEIVLADRGMIDAVNAILDEQIAVMTFDGCIAEDDAEQQICAPENVRRVVLEVADSMPFRTIKKDQCRIPI